ncbi:subtilisin family serine protease [Allocatelliglobosispora scoriae]|uniref:Subtilisin family serine protease n=1 Tax=Allocatelliglobosispora scoriae TaxID=643052 RepID=A0A841BNC0_9ACTN|nr:S8 family peptidase [Allocatelliglobosispora scoriae]MBB5868689.1 subtilisin family serine protease [Allocatelliglobosispora scoriae]
MNNRSIRRLVIVVGIAAAVGLTGVPAQSSLPVASANTTLGKVLYAESPGAVPGSYIVVFKDSSPSNTSDELKAKYNLRTTFEYGTALRGFAIAADDATAARVAADPLVEYVAQDQEVTTQVSVQTPTPSWGLDRIDERSLPLDNKYHYANTAPGVRAYIIDTGIRYTHVEFGGRAVPGFDAFGGTGADCNGHGTHVAGTVGGKTVGVAKQVKLISVRVLNCAGSGTAAGVIAGVNWVTLQQILSPAPPSVANMSLGGSAFPPLDTAVTNSITANVHYSVAAGNSNLNACGFSPARVPRATTVGATTNTDARATFSNFGPCLDLFAPGQGIYSAYGTADNAYATLSGTSMASPHAAGVAALWRWRFPADNADQTALALVNNATPNVVINPGVGSPNLLLFAGFVPV